MNARDLHRKEKYSMHAQENGQLNMTRASRASVFEYPAAQADIVATQLRVLPQLNTNLHCLSCTAAPRFLDIAKTRVLFLGGKNYASND